jgi:hypothetical protein
MYTCLEGVVVKELGAGVWVFVGKEVINDNIVECLCGI